MSLIDVVVDRDRPAVAEDHQHARPARPSRPASVTTNDGRPIRVMIVPWSSADRRAGEQRRRRSPPTTASRRAGFDELGHDRRRRGRRRSRSTGRSRRAAATKTSPIASSMKTAAWTSRLTRLPAVRKFELRDWKRIEIRISPATTGRTPLSPALILASDGAEVVADGLGGELGRNARARPGAPPPRSPGAPTRAARRSRRPWPSGVCSPFSASSRSDVPVVIRSTTICRSSSLAGPQRDHAAEIEHDDPVGDLEDVVHVVRHDQRRDAPARPACA